jgi:hypothetical protein
VLIFGANKVGTLLGSTPGPLSLSNITDHFKGTIDLLEANQGAHFLIQLPIRTKKPAQIKTSSR